MIKPYFPLCRLVVIANKLASSLHHFFESSTMKSASAIQKPSTITSFVSRGKIGNVEKIYIPTEQVEFHLYRASGKIAEISAKFPELFHAENFREYMLSNSRVIMRKWHGFLGLAPTYVFKIPTYAQCVDAEIIPSHNQAYKFYYAVLEEENFFLARKKPLAPLWKRYDKAI